MAATKTRHMTTVNTFRDQNITSSNRAAMKAAATLLVCRYVALCSDIDWTSGIQDELVFAWVRTSARKEHLLGMIGVATHQLIESQKN